MDRPRVVAVIPARYSSTRFPGKPLASLLGAPMIAHVVDRVCEAGCCDEIAVATDDERIVRAAERAGARAVLTGPAASGTDRVAEALGTIAADIVLNVQGDEPAMSPANISRTAEFLVAHPEAPLATLALPATAAELADPNVVKVVRDLSARALYFSRSAIPHPRNPGPGAAHKHVGLYGFQREALARFTSWPETELERIEGLEQLRALEHGMAVVVLDAVGESVAVDVPADVPRAEAALARLGVGAAGGSTVRRAVSEET
jgi:3-deoxy-manno-octulosonate cytidylyltransferase (CMP-KDO synthetase)